MISFIYTYIAEKFNDWENYQKHHNLSRDLSIKIVFFEFINSYNSYFIIGFIKPNVWQQLPERNNPVAYVRRDCKLN